MSTLAKQFLDVFPELRGYFAGVSIDKNGDGILLKELPEDGVQSLVERGWVRAVASGLFPDGQTFWRYNPDAASFVMCESEISGISEPPEKKEINVIVTGRLSKSTHDKIVELLRNEPVDLQFMPTFVELLPAAHQEPISVSLHVCDIFAGAADQFLAEFSTHVEEAIKAFGKKDKFLVLSHLFDRLVSSPQHVTVIHREEPFFSYIDTSSLNRSNLEAAVTFLYFLKDPGNSALKSLCRSSLQADFRRIDELEKWVSHPDLAVSTSAKKCARTYGKLSGLFGGCSQGYGG